MFVVKNYLADPMLPADINVHIQPIILVPTMNFLKLGNDYEVLHVLMQTLT